MCQDLWSSVLYRIYKPKGFILHLEHKIHITNKGGFMSITKYRKMKGKETVTSLVTHRDKISTPSSMFGSELDGG